MTRAQPTARAEQDTGVRRRYAGAVAGGLGWEPEPGRFRLFAAGIEQVTFISYDDLTGDQHVAMWPPTRAFIRRGTSATSVGDPGPVSDLLLPS